MLAYFMRVLLPSTTRGLQRPDVILGSSVHPLAAAAGRLLAQRFRVPFVFEVRDLWPQTLIDMGAISANGLPAKLMRSMERWLYRHADRIIVLLPKADDYLVPLGIARERIIYIPNGVEIAERPGPAKASGAKFTLMYLGAHGQANGLHTLLEAMDVLRAQGHERNIQLRMIGDGPLKAELAAAAKAMGLTNISFEAAVPKSCTPEIAAQADAFVIVVRNLPNLYRFGISPNKLFDYMAAERPTILAAAVPDNLIDKAGAGMTVPPDDPRALAAGILKMASLPDEERACMGRAGRAYVETHHSYQALAKRLANVLDDVVARCK